MWDGIVIGGGFAGLIAGIRASERGKRILMIAEGTGSLSSSSGVFDIGPIPSLARLEKHPYSYLEPQNIQAAVEYFRSLLPEYEKCEGESSLVLTPLGSCRTADLMPMGLKAEALIQSKEIVLMAPEGMKDFFSRVVKENLEKEFPQSRVEIYPFQVSAFAPWQQVGKAVNGLEFARFWRTEEGIETLQKLLEALVRYIRNQKEAAVVFPGLSRVFNKPLQKLLAHFPCPIIEMTDIPPTFGGEILYDALKRKFKEFGGEIILGSGVRKVDIQGKNCFQVWVKSKGSDSNFQAKELVLATGGSSEGGSKRLRME
ncbi:FAD-binding protein [Desulfitobacterium sp. Sab5]|uniref:FAD-binding protein n=1 Tax=Desulfitobacterium nosdiversum TaxID=3375356 RepID=UPI003CE79A4E